jgi:aldose 1-epimerase
LSNFDDFKTFKKIDQYTFDTCFTVDTSSGVASVKLHSATDNLEIEAWQETGPDKYNYVQIYTPPSRSSIAIEPMTCMPDAFNNRQGLVVLEPKQTLELKCGVRTKSISK